MVIDNSKHVSFSIIYGIILPIDEFIFFKMVKATNQMVNGWLMDG